MNFTYVITNIVAKILALKPFTLKMLNDTVGITGSDLILVINIDCAEPRSNEGRVFT